MLVNGDIGRRAYRAAVRDTSLHLKPGHLYETIREPYFFSYVRDELIAEYGANTVRSGGLRVYTTIDRRFQRAALASIRKTLYERSDPAAARRRDRPAERRDPRDDLAHAERAAHAVQPRRPGAPPGRVDVQDVRARGRGRAGHQPEHDLLPLDAVHVPARPVRKLRDQLVVRHDLRQPLPRHGERRDRDRCTPTTPSSRS